MPHPNEMTIGARCVRKVITVPASAGTALTISSLASLTPEDAAKYIGCKILGRCTDGTERAAITLGDSAASLPQYVVAGADYAEPARDDETYTYVKIADGAALPNVVVLFYAFTV